MSHEIRTLGVVGAGQMGNGIAHVAALSGYRVVLSDVSQDAVNKGLSAIDGNMARMVKKATLTQEAAAAARALIVGATTLDAMSEADLVVEAVSENEALKFRIFETLSRVAPAHALLCSNTSSISITAIAAHTDRPTQVVGMHFMNPVPVMKLVRFKYFAAWDWVIAAGIPEPELFATAREVERLNQQATFMVGVVTLAALLLMGRVSRKH